MFGSTAASAAIGTDLTNLIQAGNPFHSASNNVSFPVSTSSAGSSISVILTIRLLMQGKV